MITIATKVNAAASGVFPTPLCLNTCCPRKADARTCREDEVPECQREREDRSSNQAGFRQRHHDRRNVRHGLAPRSLDASRNEGHPLEGRLDRHDHERKPQIRVHDDEAEPRWIRMTRRPPGAAGSRVRPRRARASRSTVEDPLLGQDLPPREGAHEVARPQRHQHRQVEERLHSRRRVPRHVVRERESEQGTRRVTAAAIAQYGTRCRGSRATRAAVCRERERARSAR